MYRLASLTLSLAVAPLLLATAQIPDTLVVDGTEYSLQANPLGPWLREHPNALPESKLVSTANWRGYLAKWTLRDGKLLLVDVTVSESIDETRSVMKELFPGGGPVEATWFTGHLIVPTGEMVNYVHMGYASTYSSYLVATIVNGRVQAKRNFTQQQFEAFRREQWARYRKTPEYAAQREEAKRGDASAGDQQIDDFLFVFADYVTRVYP